MPVYDLQGNPTECDPPVRPDHSIDSLRHAVHAARRTRSVCGSCGSSYQSSQVHPCPLSGFLMAVMCIFLPTPFNVLGVAAGMRKMVTPSIQYNCYGCGYVGSKPPTESRWKRRLGVALLGMFTLAVWASAFLSIGAK